MRSEPRGVIAKTIICLTITETYYEPFEPEPDNTGVGMALKNSVSVTINSYPRFDVIA